MDDDEQITTTRRTFLGAAAALGVLPTMETADHRAPSHLLEEAPGALPGYRLAVNGSDLQLSKYNEEAELLIATHPTDPSDCATVSIRASWGDAGVFLTAEEARALASALEEAAGRWEGE